MAAGFWGKLGTIPFFKSTVDIYEASKEKSRVLGAGFSAVEMGVKLAAKPLQMAVTTIKEAYPEQGEMSKTHRPHSWLILQV